MDPTLGAWVALFAGLVALLLVDLLVLHRDPRSISFGDATWSTLAFVAVGLLFGLVLAVVEDHHVAGQYYAGYLLELSLSLDNVFVWAVIFGAFSVPPAYQRRALFYGVFGALVLRFGFVAAGAELLRRFEWVVYVFGVLLIFSGVRMLRGGEPRDPATSPVVRLLRRELPTTRGLAGAHLFVRASAVPEELRPARRPIAGVWYATPLLAVLGVIELTDLVFAVDSIPAIFGVTRETFVVFSATALALIGLRSMYFMLAGMRERFAYLDVGLAVLLVFIGAKFLLTDVVHIGVGVSLLAIVAIVGTAVAVSLLRPRTRV
jgi:TerC family integral membrane protein